MIADKNRERIGYLDALRTVACFFVVALHIAASNTYNVDIGSYEWYVFMGYESITNWAVPMFVMISGAVMLSRDYDYKTLAKKALKIATLFFVWSAIFLLLDIAFNGTAPYTNAIWLQVLLQGHYHEWYLIMIAGLYVIVPLIKAIIDQPHFVEVFIGLSLVFTFIIPSVLDTAYLVGINELLLIPVIGAIYRALSNVYSDLNFHFTAGFVAYFVIRHWIANRLNTSRNRYMAYGLSCLLTGSVIVFLELHYCISKDAALIFMSHYQIGILLQACGILMITKSLQDLRIIGFLTRFSPLTLGIYIIHPIGIELLTKFGITSLSFEPIVTITILSILIFLVTGLMVWLLIKTPFVKLLTIKGASQ